MTIQTGSYVAWGNGKMGVVHHLSDDGRIAYIRNCDTREIFAVAVAKLRVIRRVAVA
ncbi:MAG: hypothetical protein JXA21_01800 [Anaerolineae bacterium]|nr:hypothetical protein [Anaerolineae bacterium]